MFKMEEPIWNRASIGCCEAPLKNGSCISKIPANGIHRADHHRTHQLPLELSELFLRVRVSIRGEGSENLSFLIPAKKPKMFAGGMEGTPPPSAKELRSIVGTNVLSSE